MKSDSRYGKSSRITQTKQVAGDVRLALAEKGRTRSVQVRMNHIKVSWEATKVTNRKRWKWSYKQKSNYEALQKENQYSDLSGKLRRDWCQIQLFQKGFRGQVLPLWSKKIKYHLFLQKQTEAYLPQKSYLLSAILQSILWICVWEHEIILKQCTTILTV